MTEYCDLTFSWEPDKDPHRVVEYKFGNGEAEDHHEHGRLHSRDHFFLLGQIGGDRLQVTFYPSEPPTRRSRSSESDIITQCVLRVECKPVYNMVLKGFAVASEARTLEVYDGRDDSYLQTVRGARDKEDSEADDSKIHFMCRCTLEEPLKSINIKFLSLGPRQSFEIAHIRLMLKQCSSAESSQQRPTGQNIDMEKLRREVDEMGDTVSERARAFLTTLENFQKSKQGGVDDLRHLLLDKSASGSDGPPLAGITTLLAMFSCNTMGSPSPLGAHASPASMTSHGERQVEGSVMNQMLTQMMSSLALGEGRAQGRDREEMFNFLKSMCSQVAQQRGEVDALDAPAGEKLEGEKELREEASVALETKLDSLVESRLDAVEERLMSRVDAHLAELESRMSSKLDAVLALLQNAAPPAAPQTRLSQSEGQQ